MEAREPGPGRLRAADADRPRRVGPLLRGLGPLGGRGEGVKDVRRDDQVAERLPMQSPYLAIANKAMEQMRAMLTEFGMSPSSRTRVHVTPPRQGENALEALRRRYDEHEESLAFDRLMARKGREQ